MLLAVAFSELSTDQLTKCEVHCLKEKGEEALDAKITVFKQHCGRRWMPRTHTHAGECGCH